MCQVLFRETKERKTWRVMILHELEGMCQTKQKHIDAKSMTKNNKVPGITQGNK